MTAGFATPVIITDFPSSVTSTMRLALPFAGVDDFAAGSVLSSSSVALKELSLSSVVSISFFQLQLYTDLRLASRLAIDYVTRPFSGSLAVRQWIQPSVFHAGASGDMRFRTGADIDLEPAAQV